MEAKANNAGAKEKSALAYLSYDFTAAKLTGYYNRNASGVGLAGARELYGARLDLPLGNAFAMQASVSRARDWKDVRNDADATIVALKGIAVYFVMAPREREPFHQEELKIVSDLVDVLMADSPLPSDALESQFLADWNESTNDNERLRVAIDQVASLTDNSALALHSILC